MAKKKLMTQYQKDILFIESLANIPRQNYLLKNKDRRIFVQRTKQFLSLLSSPEKKLKFIHIAGTSGKGTTTKLLETLLAQASHKTGTFTSPFSTTSIEKISIGGRLIPPPRLHQILEKKIKPALDKYALKFSGDQISYFECWLAIALLYFQEEKCSWVVLEAGLGGQHDATNAIVPPVVSAITNIGLDHQEILGKTKKEIALDKAGIIKKGSFFVSSEKNKKLLAIFQTKCQKEKAHFVNIENLADQYQLSPYFNTSGQKNNLNLTLNILKLIKVKAKHSQKIIDQFGLICRQEIVQKNPLIILDGSHNPAKLKNLIEFVQKIKFGKLHLIVGFSFGKDYKLPFKKMLAMADEIYLTRFLISERKSAPLKDLYALAKKIVGQKPLSLFHDPYQALDLALKNAKKNDLILVVGSFFLAGELRKRWQTEDDILKTLALKIKPAKKNKK